MFLKGYADSNRMNKNHSEKIMIFDAKAAKLLAPREHITFDKYPGLRLRASATRRAWIYRYKSPTDGRMRQIKIGNWPKVSFPAAIVAWEGIRAQRDEGIDPVLQERDEQLALVKEAKRDADGLTVRDICTIYLEGHIDVNRKEKGAVEIRRTFNTMTESIADMKAVDVTRSVAVDLIQGFAHIPVQASSLRRELGAAWEFALDAGKLPESAPNWWRLILRGKLKSKGKTLQGVRRGVSKRVLSSEETGELIRWLPNFTEVIRDILTMYLWTGVRGAEIMSVEGFEITEESTGLWWIIPKHKTKNSNHPEATDHRVPLYGRAAGIVRRRKGRDGAGYLYPSIGKIAGRRSQYPAF